MSRIKLYHKYLNSSQELNYFEYKFNNISQKHSILKKLHKIVYLNSIVYNSILMKFLEKFNSEKFIDVKYFKRKILFLI